MQVVAQMVAMPLMADPVEQRARIACLVSGILLLIGSVICLSFFWVHIIVAIPSLLMFCFGLVVSIIQIVHTRSREAVHRGECCCGPTSVFSVLRGFSILNLILAMGNMVLPIWLITLLWPYRGIHPIVMTLIICAFVILVGALLCFVASLITIINSGTLGQKVQENLLAQQAAMVAGAMGGAIVGGVVAGVAAVGGAVATQPTYPAAQPTYPVAQPVNQQQPKEASS